MWDSFSGGVSFGDWGINFGNYDSGNSYPQYSGYPQYPTQQYYPPQTNMNQILLLIVVVAVVWAIAK